MENLLHIKVYYPIKKQHGAALLAILAIILITMSAIALSRLSLNSQMAKRQEANAGTMATARNALTAYAMTQATPGALPCPDTNNDGIQNPPAGGVCTSRIGLLPYKTLNIAPLFDTAGQLLWYVVDANYAGNVVAPHNSSRLANLRIDGGELLAFIVIAPNTSLSGQSPTTPTPANIAQFLEGDNADATLNSYSAVNDNTHNDVLMAMSTFNFWTSVEKRVLEDAKNVLIAYKAACNVYPWAADFSSGNGNSIVNTYEGALPLGIALPNNWGTTCAPVLNPYLSQHWKGVLYYAICKSTTPVNPPASSCVNLVDASNNVIKTAKVIAIAPGVVTNTQNRATNNVDQFFEGNVVTLPNDNKFDLITLGVNNNDSLIIIEP